MDFTLLLVSTSCPIPFVELFINSEFISERRPSAPPSESVNISKGRLRQIADRFDWIHTLHGDTDI